MPMKKRLNDLLLIIIPVLIFSSCTTLEKASMHGLRSGYYGFSNGDGEKRRVYLDVSEEKLSVHASLQGEADSIPFMSIVWSDKEAEAIKPTTFRKRSLDIDINSILLKYRPSVYGLPSQLTADLNFALYAGLRYDYFTVRRRKDPLGKSAYQVSSRGFDIGFFAGPGTTLVSPFSTRNRSTNEYSGMILQSGVAAFIESGVASFGFAAGYDYLLNSDRDIWIYTHKPWIGFVVGVALN